MIRLILPLLIFGSAAVAQTTPLTDRPGRWVTVAPQTPQYEPAPQQIHDVVVTIEPLSLDNAVPRPVVQSPGLDTLRPQQRPVPPVAEAPEVALVVVPEPTRPAPEPSTAPALLADAAAILAEQLAENALSIATSPMADVPAADAVGPDVFEAIVEAPDIAETTLAELANAMEPAQPQQPRVADVVAASFGATQISGMAAVLLPSVANAERAWMQPAGLFFPAPDPAPLQSLPRPQGPNALGAPSQLPSAPTAARLAAVLMPAPPVLVPRVPAIARLDPPTSDLFPYSALPPSALPDGPEALERIVIGPAPFAAQMAAVLIAAPATAVERLPMPAPSPLPTADTPFVSPETPPELPAPDPQAVARLVEEALFCWRLANLGAEAQWAQVRVAVALDETNHASAGSIHMTGFGRVLSGAAEEAYRAAHDALTGCGAATTAGAATAHATLIFDRDGIRVR